MICDVLYFTGGNAIESFPTKLFAVLDILFLPSFLGVSPHLSCVKRRSTLKSWRSHLAFDL